MTDLPTRNELAKTIDHAVLGVAAGRAELQAGAELARRYGVKSLCVKPCHVRPAAELLGGSGVLVGATVSFPHGADVPAVKARQAIAAIDDGAVELDMVLNIAALRDGDLEAVRRDIEAVVRAARAVPVKVILECALLQEAQKLAACRAAEQAGAAFVKTSTGFAGSGASVADVALLRRSVGPEVRVKASGGIRTLADALALLSAGADRLGTSHTAVILDALPGGGV